MAAFLDLCRFVASAGGTTDWTYSSTVSPYISPAEAGAVNGRAYKLRAESADLTQWEVSEGAYSSAGAGSFARTTVLYNSSGTGTLQSGAGTKIGFTAAPQVWVVASKRDLLSIEEANGFTATQKAQARANIDALKKNYIINGAMMVSQENGTTAGTTTGYYPVDQFAYNFQNTSGVISVVQVASVTPGGSPNRLRATVTTADASVGAADIVWIDQKIEGSRVADLRYGSGSGKAITIQFGVKAPAGTYCVIVLNSAQTRSYVAEYVISGGEANTDVVKSVTIPADTTGTWLTDIGIGLWVRWGLMCGSSFQQAAGSWAATNVFGSSSQFNFMGTLSNVFELFDVGLHEGAAAPSFLVPDYPAELELCQRYWEWGGQGWSGRTLSGTDAQGTIIYREKRTAPTITWNGSNQTIVEIGAGNRTATNIGSVSGNVKAAFVQLVSSSMGTGSYVMSTSNLVKLNARL
ncbi:hypothetical protein ES703_06657 [subsurface metagenome]|nr:MAG: hypothetical protein DI543_05365 [Bradyrhizobium icense]